MRPSRFLGQLAAFTSAALIATTLPFASPASAAAQAAPANKPDGSCGLCVLAPSGNSLRLVGKAALSLTRSNLMVNSSSNDAISATGNATISAPSVGVVGGVATTGRAVVNNLTTGASAAPDPLSGAPTPAVPAGTPRSVTLNDGPRVIFPGVYSDIFVAGHGSLFLNAGTYVILDDFSVTGQGSVSGRGVTIYLACAGFPAHCSSGQQGASLELMGGGRMGLTAPSGVCSAGQLAVQSDPANTSTISLSGDPTETLTGAIYAPSGTLVTSGQGDLTIGGQVVVAQAFLNGNGRVSVGSAGTPVAAPTLTLSPASAGPDKLGSAQNLTATLVDSSGRPVANELVGLTVTGANAGTTSAVTNNAGQAALSYVGVHAGTDVAKAFFGDGDRCISSNAATVTWIGHAAVISTGVVRGNFYAEPASAGVFTAKPGDTALFSQQFPVVDFNPPNGLVPGNTSGVGPSTRPFTDVTTNLAGAFTGTTVAQGNGVQAGVASASTFDAVLSSTFVVSTPGNVSFTVIADDGFLLGVGNGATAVSGPSRNPPASNVTPFSSYPIMAAWNAVDTGPPATYAVTINFPTAGTYPYELDYLSRSAQLSLVLAVTAVSGQTPPLAVYTGYADTARTPGTSTFPFPWQGAPGVTFVGSPNPDGTWDTGALRFDNTTSSPITLDHVTVDIGSTHFDPGWNNVTVPANGTVVLAGSGQLTNGLPTGKGGIYITGHDPDYHGFIGGNAAGAQHIVQRAVAWVTFGKTSPKMLLVTDLNNPGGDQSDPRFGLTAAGFTYDVADDGSSGQVLDLHTVDFTKYDVVVVASDYGGWLRQSELDILNARSPALISFVNNGGGLVAFAECGCRGNGTGTTHDRFGYLPTVVSSAALNQSESGYTLSSTGTAMGLTTADINGNASHAIFSSTGGLTPIDFDPAGHTISLAERGVQVGQSNFDTSDFAQSSGPPPTTGTCCKALPFATDFPTSGSIGPIGVAFDSTGQLFVTDYPTGSLYRFGPSGGSASTQLVGSGLGSQASGLAFTKDGRLYLARQGIGDVVELDPATGNIKRTIASGLGTATGLATDPVSGDLFVSHAAGGAILRLSNFQNGPATVAAYANIDVDGMSFAPDGTLFAAFNSNIYRIEGTSSANAGAVTQVASGVNSADGIAFITPPPGQPVTRLVVNRNDGIMTLVDLSTTPATLSNVVTGGTRGDFVTVGPDGCLYATQTSSVEKVTFTDGSCPFVPVTPVCATTIPVPQVHVTTNGQTATFADSTKVLAVDGHDAECGQPPANTNESSPWVQLNPGTPGINVPMPPTLTLAILPASLPATVVGRPLTLGVTALDSSGQAVSQLPITLGVTGANPQQLTATTDSAGAASFTYTGASGGTDTITATAFQGGALQVSNTVSTVWTIPLPAPGPTTTGQGAPAIFGISPPDQTPVSARTAISATISAPAGFAVASWSVSSQLLPGGTVTALASGSGAPPTPLATFDPAGQAAGTYAITISATSTGGGSATATTRLIIAGAGTGGGAGGSADQAPPSITQPSPPDGTIVYSPIPIQATVTPPAGHTVTSWSVTVQAQAGGAPITLATGTGAPPSPMTVLDPTLLPNDTYTVTISATTDAGATQMLVTSVLVAGGLKLGRAVSSYRDLTVPVNGFQMEVNRVYDSTDTRSGDFGFGWHLDLANFRVSVNRPLGAGGWTEAPVSCFIICNWGFKTAAPHFVTVTYPDGHQEAFDLTPANTGLTLIDFANSTAGFTARPGVGSSLAVANASDQALTNGFDGNLYNSTGGIYNPTQFILTTRDGRVLTLDESRGLIAEKDPSGNTVTVDASGVHTSSGSSLTFTRDAAGRITQVKGPAGEKLTYAYSSAGDLVSYTNAAGGVSSYTYDDSHRIVATTGGSATFTNTFDSQGRLAAITDANGHTTQITDDAGAMTQTTVDAAGLLTTVDAFDALGDLVQETRLHDGTSQVYEFSYDSLGHVVNGTDPLGDTTSVSYDGAGDIIDSFDALGHVSRYAYDVSGHATQITNPDGVVQTTLSYDAAGRLTNQASADGSTSAYSYDGSGRVASVVSNKNGTTSLAYSATGDLITLTNPSGSTAHMTYDASGRMLSVSGPLGVSVSYAYDPLGDLTSVTDSLGNSQTAVYDPFGRMTATNTASGHTATFTYDAAGLQTSSTDPLGATTNFSYDADSRLVSQTAGARTETYTYDGAGHMTSAVNSVATVRFTYDAADRATSQTEAGPGLPTTTVSDAYDAAGHVIAITGPQGTIKRTYDVDGRLAAITDGAGTSTFAYNSGSQPVSLVRPNGAIDSLTYDSAGRLTGRSTASSGSTVDFLAYTYTASGEIASQTHNGDTATFTYDAAGRLVGVQHTDPSLPAESFGYDTRNNRTSWSGAPGAYTYGLDDQVLSSPTASFAYDAAGQRTSMTDAAGRTSFVWDANHNLQSATSPAGRSVAFGYDALGRRVSVTSGATTQAFVYSGAQVLAQYGNGTLQSAFTPVSGGGAPLDVTQGGKTDFYLQDQLGTVNGLLDGSGARAQSYTYSAFGVQGLSSGSVNNPFTFSSLQYDSTAGAYYANARYYDPQNGAFLSRDTISALNPYGYVGGDPVNFSDPTGAYAAEYGSILNFDLTIGDRALGCATGAIASAFASAILKLVKPQSFDLLTAALDTVSACALGATFPQAGRSVGWRSRYPNLYPNAASSLLRGQAGYIGYSALIGFMFGMAVDLFNQALCGKFNLGHAVTAGFWGAIGGTAGGVIGNLSVNATGRVAAAYAIAGIFIASGIGTAQGLLDNTPVC